MTRRFNFRVPNDIAEHVEKIAQEVNEQGGNGTISQVARALLEEGLRSMANRDEPTPNERGSEFETRIYREIRAALWDAPVEHLHPAKGEHRPDIRAPFFDVECKIGKRPSTRQALAQARQSTAEGQAPMAVIQDDDGAPFVVLDWSTFLAMWRAVYELAIFAEELPRRLRQHVDR
jgi:hypothetical protein